MNMYKEQFNIGYAMFKNNLKKIIPKDVIHDLQKPINKPIWNLNIFNSNTKLWILLFEKMTQTRVKQIVFNKNKYPLFTKLVSHIQFLELKILELDQNNITNIQSLCFIYMPNLQYLSLSYLFSNFSKQPNLEFKKLFFQILLSKSVQNTFSYQNIFIKEKNCILNFQSFERLSILNKNFSKKKFQICAQSIFQFSIKQDLSFLAKINLKKKNQTIILIFPSSKRISQQKIRRKISI